MSERPEWVQGAEWDGWEWSGWAFRRSTRDTSRAVLNIEIHSDGYAIISVPVYDHLVSLRFPSPEAARVAAMAIIEGMK